MPTNSNNNTIVELRRVSHSFSQPSGNPLKVVESIDLQIKSGEILGLLGPSGSGKSTILRILVGLIKPTEGEVFCYGQKLNGINPWTSIVFQKFALFPWLNVQENIAVGFEGKNIDPGLQKEMTAKVIDKIGLDGFEEAYPRELSGGMKQRVGIARALVSDTELLCLDEPFSELDVLTAIHLRDEVLNLWLSHEKNPKAIFLVTHNIQETVYLANRIVILKPCPARIDTIIENNIPYPRDYKSAIFAEMVDKIQDIVTNVVIPEKVAMGAKAELLKAPLRIDAVPRAEITEIIGLLEALNDNKGRLDMFDFAGEVGKDFGRIALIVKAAELLDFADSLKHDIIFTELGKKFIAGDINERKTILNKQMQNLGLVKIIVDMLTKSGEKKLEREMIIDELALLLPTENPDRIFRTLVSWGRYAELLGYNAREKTVYLDKVL